MNARPTSVERRQIDPDVATNPTMFLDRYGSVDGFRFVDDAGVPEPRAGEVRIRVEATSACITDVIIRKGNYPEVRKRPPLVLGYDLVGRVDAIGDRVTRWKVGDRVADLATIGSYARSVCRDAEGLVAVPEEVDAAEAVSMVLSWLTAYQMVHRIAHVAPHQTVLVHGAAGAVGQALVTLCRMAGARVIGTASREDAERVRAMGGEPIDYRSEDFVKRTRELAGGDVDAVFDFVSVPHFARSLQTLGRGGVLVTYGLHETMAGPGGLWPLIASLARQAWWNLRPDGKRSRFYSITARRRGHPEEFREDLEALFALLARGEIRPRIADRLPLESAAEAHRRLERGSVDGKLVLIP